MGFGIGAYYVQALDDGTTWTGTTGQAASVGYSFATSVEGGALFNVAQRSAAEAAMQLWENVANIQLSEVAAGAAALTFSQEDLGSNVLGLASVFFSGTTIASVEVQIDDQYTSLSSGTEGFRILLHEVGHALGLKHPANYSGSENPPFLSGAEESFQATVMSYNEGALVNDGRPPVTPMLYDVAAIQALYGANTSYNSGDSGYSLSGAAQALTVWDGGGTDLLSAATSGTAAVIDLREDLSTYSVVGSTYAWIAFNANIENGEGGSAGDGIYGNALGNTLYGRGGSDTLYGFTSNDTLYGGTGVVDAGDAGDTLYGGAGIDALYGNGGADVIYGGDGVVDPTDSADLVYGGGGADAVFGNGGADTLAGGGATVDPNDAADTVYGGGGADSVFGNGGADSLFGGGATVDPNDTADTIYGGVGGDYILGNGGGDVIYGNEDNDTMHAGVGNDTYAFGSSSGADLILLFENPGASAGDSIQLASNINGSGIASASDVLSRITYSGSSAVIDLGSGNSITIQDITSGSLTADDFSIA